MRRAWKKPVPVALTVAGSDSGGCAGIQADLRTFSALGVHGASVICTLTAQNTLRVAGVHDVPAAFVGLQFDTVCEDLPVSAVKTGMLSTAENIEVVVDRLQRWGLRRTVVDPVMVSTSGARLIDPEATEVLVRRLFPLAALVTPNLREAEALTGLDVDTPDALLEAGRRLLASGAGAVLIKGGHGTDPGTVVDLLVTPAGAEEFAAPRIDTPHTHGSGCTLAAAVAAGLAHGLEVREAVEQARRFVTEAIRYGYAVGAGSGPLGHFFFEAAAGNG
ncbi:MAG: bifunctional hydroxymethylpyrimidine kinase/phosphomethylpyrimidine kinase [Acidobacteriota bacterium]